MFHRSQSLENRQQPKETKKNLGVCSFVVRSDRKHSGVGSTERGLKKSENSVASLRLHCLRKTSDWSTSQLGAVLGNVQLLCLRPLWASTTLLVRRGPCPGRVD